jgi:hypothetical protein
MRILPVVVTLLGLTSSPLLAQMRTVAVTVDDLPYAGGSGRPGALPVSQALAQEVHTAILAGLQRQHVDYTDKCTPSLVNE